MVRREDWRVRRKLPKSLEQRLSSVKDFEGYYEHERDYRKVYQKLKNTHPFSVLVFYETPKTRISLPKRKKLNPHVPEQIVGGGFGYNQFYFTPELKEMRVGGPIGTSYCETQSTYALALALLSKKINVPTYILILDKQAVIKYVLSSRKLIVQPQHVSYGGRRELADELLKNTIIAYRGEGDLDKIKSICIVRP